jgi:quercetin dioxygenase-like cupin family protein
MTTVPLEGWDIGSTDDAAWIAWGEGGRARAKILGGGDGYVMALVEADGGYAGTPHEHTYTEFLYVIAGRIRNQGRTMRAGDAYVASAGSQHTDFEAETATTYLSIFKL